MLWLLGAVLFRSLFVKCWMFVCWGWHIVGVGLAKFWFVMAVGCLGQSVVPFVWMLANGRMITSVWLFVCCGCSVLFENCIVDASIFFFVIFCLKSLCSRAGCMDVCVCVVGVWVS